MNHFVTDIVHVRIAAPGNCASVTRNFFGQLPGLEEIPKPEILASDGAAGSASVRANCTSGRRKLSTRT